MVKAVQYNNRTIITVSKGRVNTDLLAFQFHSSMHTYSFLVRHWCGGGHISHKHFWYQFLTNRDSCPICEKTTITLRDRTVTFQCRGWEKKRVFRSHYKAVVYANRLLYQDLMGDDYIQDVPASPNITEYDSFDRTWNMLCGGIFLSSRQEASLDDLCHPKLISLELVGRQEQRYRIRIEGGSYAILWNSSGEDVLTFKLSDLRVIGNLKFPPYRWDTLIDTIHQLLMNLHRMHGSSYEAFYDEGEQEYIVRGWQSATLTL